MPKVLEFQNNQLKSLLELQSHLETASPETLNFERFQISLADLITSLVEFRDKYAEELQDRNSPPSNS